MIDQNSQFFAILTAVGEAKQANADALGVPWTFAQMGVGDANGTDPMPDRLQKTLINERRRAPLNQLKTDPNNPSIIIAEQVIPENVGGWWIREIGLYDAAGDLVAIANCAPSFKPLLSQGSGRTQVVRMNLIVSSTANVELKIDPSVVLATRSYVDAKVLEEIYKLDSKQSVRVATTANIVLSGLLTLDTIVLVAGDRVLVKNQAAAKDNGLYVAAAGAWARATDADTSAKVTPALLVSVEQGTTQADTRWQLITDGAIVLGTTALTFQNITQGFATINSPAFTGNPTAPTAAVGDNDTSIANTAFVQAAIAALVASSPAALDTLSELAAALGDDPNFATTVTNALALKATLASPTLTGDPKAPTPAAGDSDTSIATTAYVQNAINGAINVSIAGTGNVSLTAAQAGASTINLTGVLTGNKTVTVPSAAGRYLFINSSTGKFTVTVKTAAGAGQLITQGQSSLMVCDGANVLLQQTDFISPVLSGNPTAPTPAVGANDLSVATAAFVQRALSNLQDQFGSGLLPSGYQRLSSGLILQWGSVSSLASGPVTVTLPIAFDTAALRVYSTTEDTANPNVSGARALSKTQISVSAWGGTIAPLPRTATTVGWLAIGD
ncbi:Phage tail-collar fibre protein [Pseudomonas sp. ok272]|uniref:phage tail-collar fiber domain-containing protein n=1 Tax=unclassified Pseudomonas TaxID=196821 RepID=UPI0008CE058D|nr:MULTISPECIES: phage tail protein [unclassified Pseudomonas]SEN18792.1 Phage tail-collar fibre protein [Pseudomonas sp. ok272]SFN10743.1 Phage tail-collar fibre protein [Pseudomonas sp. ok602]